MRVNRRTRLQLAVFAVVALVAAGVMVFGYLQAPALLGIGRYTVTVELPRSGGLYSNGNVTYRGVEVGRITGVHLTDSGAEAVLSLKSGIAIPSDLDAQVHSVSAVGEQYVALLPRDSTSAPLKNGDVIAREHTSIPPDLDGILDAANTGVQAIPRDDLKSVIDESYAGVGGLGPELSRIVKGASTLSADADANIDALTAVVDKSGPLLKAQSNTADSIAEWAANAAVITRQLKTHDNAVAGILANGGAAAGEGQALIDRLRPTLPVLLANLGSVGQVAVTYQRDLEQLLVLVPAGIAQGQDAIVPNLDNPGPSNGAKWLTISPTQLNLPPPCTTGFLPATQRRATSLVDYPDRPAGDLYCRVPQDSPFNVRGARNIPCETKPGKRAPTAKMCESDEQYVPLNDGMSWKGDPNATLSGQDVPQLAPGAQASNGPSAPNASVPPPIPATEYDPATGSYIGPDGQRHTQADLAQNAPAPTWQSMLTPPGN